MTLSDILPLAVSQRNRVVGRLRCRGIRRNSCSYAVLQAPPTRRTSGEAHSSLVRNGESDV